MPGKRPFPVIARLAAISIAYSNADFIADLVLPYVPVDEEIFFYPDFTGHDIFTIPENMEVGRKGAPQEVEFTSENKTSSVKDYALKSGIPISDIESAQRSETQSDPEAETTEELIELVKLGREVRTARLVQNRNNYPVDQRLLLGADDQLNNPNSNPIDLIKRALDVPLMRPNTLVLGQAAWTELRSHKKIVSATLKNSGEEGMATRQAVAELFEVKQVIVGQGRYNVSRKGQPRQLARIWGNHMSLLHINPKATTKRSVSFGYTARLGTPWAGSAFDKNISARGGVEVRAGERVRELIVASDCGYFIENVVGG